MSRQIVSFFSLGAAVSLLALLSAGCSQSLAVVGGTVTDQGRAVASADVVVAHPEDPDQQFFGVTGEDGSLHVTYRTEKGLPPGPYQIRIRYTTQRDGQPLPPGEEGAVLRQTGATLTREFVFSEELQAGPNQLDLKLENGQPAPPAAPSADG